MKEHSLRFSSHTEGKKSIRGVCQILISLPDSINRRKKNEYFIVLHWRKLISKTADMNVLNGTLFQIDSHDLFRNKMKGKILVH